MLDIKIRQAKDIVILDLCGRIDVDSANLVEIVGQCVRDGYADILCNLEDIQAIDYMGISVVVIAYKEVINHQGRIKFTNIPAQLRSVFSVSGMDRVVEIYASEDLALNSFKEDKIIENIKKMQLRRRFKRLPIDIKVELHSKFEKSPACYNVDILNISAVGAYIYGCAKFKLGDEVILKFKVPPKQEEIELDAKVVWLCDRKIQPQLYPGVGVAFHSIQSATQQRLLAFIERNLSLSPNE